MNNVTGQTPLLSSSLIQWMLLSYPSSTTSLLRFLQADTLVPGVGDPLAWDRYAYVQNNPLRYTDPSGHRTCEQMPWECSGNKWQQGVLNSSPDLPGRTGGYWVKLDNSYTFSAYVIADERDFRGVMVDIPGVSGYRAKSDFLFGPSGVGMQGTGVIIRGGKDIYIQQRGGHWELGGKAVRISDGWHYASTGVAIDPNDIKNIKLVEATFYISDKPDLTPHYSVAAPPKFPKGTQLYVPAFDRILEVQDRGGAFSNSQRRFDLFVGRGWDPYNSWIKNPARINADVYQWIPVTVSHTNAQ